MFKENLKAWEKFINVMKFIGYVRVGQKAFRGLNWLDGSVITG
jgi:hypothetical protein